MQLTTILILIFVWLATVVFCMSYFIFEGTGKLSFISNIETFLEKKGYHSLFKLFIKCYLALNFLLFISISIYDIATKKEPCKESISYWSTNMTGINVDESECQDKNHRNRGAIERCAIPNGGGDSIYDFFEKNKKNTEGEIGTVRVSFYVMKDGSLADFSIASSDNSDLNDEAIRLIKEYPRGWKPAISYRQAVKQRVVLPISF